MDTTLNVIFYFLDPLIVSLIDVYVIDVVDRFK